MTETTERDAAEARYREMARERHRLEERAEEEASVLAWTLAEIRDLDGHQRHEAYRAGMQGHIDRTPLEAVLSYWVGCRLGDPGSRVGPPVKGGDHEKTLAELDRLASK